MTHIEKHLKAPRIALLLDNLKSGGAERVIIELAHGIAARGYSVDLLVCELQGELASSISDAVNLIELEPESRIKALWQTMKYAGREGFWSILYWLASARKIPNSFRYIRPLGNYLQMQRPVAILSASNKCAINSVLAVSAVNATTRVLVGIQVFLSVREEESRKSGKGQISSMIPALRYTCKRADCVIAASKGVAADSIDLLGLDPERVSVVYNPVSRRPSVDSLEVQNAHPWFRPGAPPVILGIGRMAQQKNFPLLLRAFAILRKHTDARLVIVGGDQSSTDQVVYQESLQRLARELGIDDCIDLVGYQSNPQKYLEASRVFVLSSDYEGFGNVLVEALLAGCPVVSTDCPSGPAEILDGGRYGMLVPIKDVNRMSQAILKTLNSVPDSGRLRCRGEEFSLQRAVEEYLQLCLGEMPARQVN